MIILLFLVAGVGCLGAAPTSAREIEPGSVVTGSSVAVPARPESAASAGSTVILVTGAPGEPQYGRDFAAQAEAWRKAAQAMRSRVVTIGQDGASGANGPADHQRLKEALVAERRDGPDELWIVLTGHGTFDGAQAKFNLRGPDLAATQLADWLKPFTRPVIAIDVSSASAPFLTALSAPNRVVITATRSGFEQNYARFGRFLAEAVVDARSDLDKDAQVSVLEAFLVAARATKAFYQADRRLPTEHPLIDDNGDGRGTPADWFKGTRATKSPDGTAEVDGARARQLALVRSAQEQQLAPQERVRRDALELRVEELRRAKGSMPEQQYFDRLETLMLELAVVYEGT